MALNTQSPKSRIQSIENIEFDLFLEALKRFHGYDLTLYSRSSLMRRVKSLVLEQKLNSISQLIPLLASDDRFYEHTINTLMVNVSSLFRDPHVFSQLKQLVFPYLESFPRLTIWVAGCAEGLEAYSLAILLAEANLLDRTHIFASDINSEALKQAESGVLTKSLDADDVMRYNESQGAASLSDYFTTAYGKQKLKQKLLSKITFEHHDLTQHPVFLSAQLVLCRNVLIYFKKELKVQVINALSHSLENNGHLVIGTKESLDFVETEDNYNVLDPSASIYKK
ncbi:MAG: CheR family methyltransferase [Methylophagaceae bacterium]